ncbi:MAG: hypothetical protein KAX55_00485 [Propionivibrio sp.]|nr:hypothetical protein [Propionivibrio sp.]
MNNETEARTIEEGRLLAEKVVNDLGGSLSAWEPCSPEIVGYWEYANAGFDGVEVRVGVSSGGVVSLNGRPFTPDGLMNVTETAVRESFLRLVANSTLCADAELRDDGSYSVKLWCSREAEPTIDKPSGYHIQFEAHPQGEFWDFRSDRRAQIEQRIRQFAEGNRAQSGIYWRRKHGIASTRVFDTCEEMIDHVVTNIVETEKSDLEKKDQVTRRLSMKFGELLAETVTANDGSIEEVVRRNRDEAEPGICHSHDFCDANVVMETAFIQTLNRAPDLSSDLDTRLWTEAWNEAKRNGFQGARAEETAVMPIADEDDPDDENACRCRP